MAHIKQVVETESIVADKKEKRPRCRASAVRRTARSEPRCIYPQRWCYTCKKWMWLQDYYGHKCIASDGLRGD